jgi:hypothetical protein
MTKKEFKKKCERLEKLGWILVDYIPNLKQATYVKDDVKRLIK